ncbi:MAG: hypothetical protein O2807_02105 [bacterium]|nr:hypothetical protein [bacterium]
MIIRLLFYLFLAWAIYYAMTSIFKGKGEGREPGHGGEGFEGELRACPECHTYFPPDTGVLKKAGEERLLFCGPDCAEQFAARGKPKEEKS